MNGERKIVWSYGGGVQSIAILVLIAQGKLPMPELAIMADTGRERSSTWRYLEQYAEPLMEEIGLSFKVASHDLATVLRPQRRFAFALLHSNWETSNLLQQ